MDPAKTEKSPLFLPSSGESSPELRPSVAMIGIQRPDFDIEGWPPANLAYVLVPSKPAWAVAHHSAKLMDECRQIKGFSGTVNF